MDWIAYALAWFAGINLAAWLAFASDKRAAILKGRRVPESTLLTLALIGGSPAAIAAQQILRHKTRKEPFRTQLFLIIVGQIFGVTLLVVSLTIWLP